MKKKKIKSSKVDTSKYKNIINEVDLEKLIKSLNNKAVISVDTETTSLNPLEAELVGISVCCNDNEAYYIPVAHKKVKSLDLQFVLKKLNQFLKIKVLKK